MRPSTCKGLNWSIKVLDGPVSDLPVAFHFSLLGPVSLFANETVHPTSG